MTYASVEDLAAFMGIDASEMPTSAGVMIDRASELLDDVLSRSIELNDAENLNVMRRAACAQVEYWIDGGTSSEKGQYVTQRTAMKVSEVYAEPGPYLAPRARRILSNAGLFYSGVQ